MVAALDVAQVRVQRQGHGVDQSQGMRMDRLHPGGEIDDPDDLARSRVVDRRRRAGPPLHSLAVVLRGEDLQSVVGGEGRPIAFVPAAASLQRAPGTKFISSAACDLARVRPSIDSTSPSASVTTIR